MKSGDDKNEVTEMWKEHRAAIADQHREWHEANRRLIISYGVPFTDKKEALLFREAGMPKVDFYPSTGRWRVAGEKKTYRGGAKAWHKWYMKFYEIR